VILVRAGGGTVPFALAVQTAYFPASAAEFPNDNPGLHQGVRWVCRQTLGAARALLRAPQPGSPLQASRDASSSVPSDTREQGVLVPEPSRSWSAAALTSAPSQADPALLQLRLAGPLELDLGRIVLPHRVENVPPPPEFIFRPFVSSRARDLRLALATLCAPPLEPLRYRIVDQRAASSRVQRGWRVDIAPCLSIGAAALEQPQRLRAESAAVVSLPADSMPTETMPVVSLPLEVVLAEPVCPEPLRAEPVRREPARRTRRRAAARAARAPGPSPLPQDGELERAISDLEAFAERPWGAERRRSPRAASACTSLSSAVLSALSAGGI